MIEAERISYIRKNQNILRADTFTNLLNSVASSTSENSMMGNRIKLPSSFTGRVRYMIENYRDAMALCRVFGYPNLFLTFTCNPKWPQPKDVDQNICAEIPDEIKESELYQLVSDLMIHGPHGEKNPSRDDGRTVTKQGHELDNRSVVAYNPYLLKRYQAHLNLEWCNQVASISYLFKYINKGNDRITAHLCNSETDEIQEYYGCRYVSSCEAVWRIMKFDIHHHYPSIIRLPFHLEGQQQIIFDEEELNDEVLEKPSVNTSMFIEWMNCNASNQEARELTYVEFPKKFIWNKYNRIFNSYRDAYYDLGLLDDDKEYTEGIQEAFFGEGGHFVRKLFAQLLLSNTMSRPEVVFEKTFRFLSVDVVHPYRTVWILYLGGKTVVFGGDFRQILPVIQKGKREDIVDAPLNSYYLWDYVTVLKLTVNMRLCGIETDANTRSFAQWILDIGNGDVGESEDGVFDIEIPIDLLITDLDDPIGSIISTIYPDYLFNLGNPEYYQQRAIHAPTHEVVNIINYRMMMCLDGEERSYLSSDSICASQRDADFNSELYTTDFLNNIEVGGLLKHNLRLKIGVPVMLLRNIDQAGGLCNGTRLQIVHIGEKIIKAKILTGSNVGKITALSRMLIVPTDKRIPFRF
ncbi:uncharacterized protein [Rutidosis leptorrhynchoides]|uniref:uncharacterized protein n=1 Tax=Rutidosis leptorrhynchoides TaxID=125765 RepID=UPI003A99DC0F